MPHASGKGRGSKSAGFGRGANRKLRGRTSDIGEVTLTRCETGAEGPRDRWAVPPVLLVFTHFSSWEARGEVQATAWKTAAVACTCMSAARSANMG